MLGVLEESYRLLGLNPGVGPEPVRRAFRTAAKACHPDAGNGRVDGGDFIRLKKAYHLVLGYEQGWRERGGKPKPGRGKAPLLARAPLDIWLTLALTDGEARRGLETVVRYHRLTPCGHCRAGCPACRGLGWVMSQEAEGLVRLVCPVCSGRGSSACPFCQGRGSIELESEAFILIPAGVEDGARLVLPGLGHKDFFRSGDLILQVEIQR